MYLLRIFKQRNNIKYMSISKEELKKMIASGYAKSIEGYDARYFITRNGEVISTKYRGNSIIDYLKPYLSGAKYYQVGLYDSNHRIKQHLLHVIIAKAFIPNPNNYPCVNHIDENSRNYRIDNLEWCTVSYNMNYGTRGDRIAKSKCKKVGQFDFEGNLIKIWDSVKEAESEGFTRQNIAACARGSKYNESHRGYKWKYIK